MRVVVRAAPRVRPPVQGPAAPQFELLPGRQPSFLASLALSVILHAAVLETTPGLLLRAVYWRFRPPEVERMMAQKARAAPLLVRAPEHAVEEKLYFRPAPPRREPGGRPKAAPPRQTEAAQAAEAAPGPARPSALVLQPSRGAAPPKQLPPLKAMAVWSGPNPRVVEEPILPGALQPGAEPAPAGMSASLEPPMAAPPRLPAAASPSAALERARVYLPPSGTSPLASRRQWLNEPEISVSAANEGTPAAFVILTPDRPKPGETFAVPPGNLVLLGSGAGQEAAAGAGTAQGRPQAPAPQQPGANGTVRVAKLEAKPSPAGPMKSGAPGEAEDSASAGRAAPEKETNGPAAAVANANGAARSAAAARTIHTATGDIFALVEGDGSVTLTYPAGGAFDVVVVDAALPQAIASHTAVLSGSPVYTAYLNVGQPVEWILHYCLPGGEGGVRRQHSVVTLSAPKPLKAPYVVEAHLPPEPLWRSSGYQVFHALLSSAGRLERLRVLQSGGAGDVLLDSLRRWLFRPALLDGAPAATEVLLVIPPFRP